jgi:hypothetical protein
VSKSKLGLVDGGKPAKGFFFLPVMIGIRKISKKEGRRKEIKEYTKGNNF